MDEREFALRLTHLREQKGVSARDMSLSIGQNPGYINNIENGKSMPSLSGLFFICDYLQITPKAFFDTDTPLPSKMQAILKDMQKLNDRQLDAVAVLVKELADT